MNMLYNMDFLISALIVLLLIFCHFISDRKMNTHRNRVFLIYMLLGIADIAMDIVTNILISYPIPALHGIMYVALTIFYILQMTVSACMVFYFQSLRNTTKGVLMRFMYLFSVPTCLMFLIILTNGITGALFTVYDNGVYVYGEWRSVPYIYGIICMLIIVVSAVKNYREFTRKQLIITAELVAITMVFVIAQLLDPYVSLTGVAIALIIMVLLFTLHNPYSYTDNLTGLYDMQFFREYIQYIRTYDRKYHIISVYIPNISYVNSVMRLDVSTNILTGTAKYLKKITRSEYIFRVERSRFVVLTNTITEYESVMNQITEYINNYGKELISRTGMKIKVCGIIDAQRLETSAVIMSYLEYIEGITRSSDGGTVKIQGDNETLKGFRYNQEIKQFLKTAIEQNLFDISFQPIYSVDENKYVAMEALSRLCHPTLGLVSPDIFIQIAERNGEIARIGYMQLTRICEFVSKHKDELAGVRNVKVNLSPAELLTPGHGLKIMKLIDSFGIEPSFFQFEITETVATQYSDDMMRTLDDFVKAGIELCMDDFGSGYANLNAVMKLPFSTVKLDKSLLTRAGEDPKIKRFYKSIASILSDLGFYLVAEGVETCDELTFIKECRVNCVQGYYFSKPLDCDAVLELLKNDMKSKNEKQYKEKVKAQTERNYMLN